MSHEPFTMMRGTYVEEKNVPRGPYSERRRYIVLQDPDLKTPDLDFANPKDEGGSTLCVFIREVYDGNQLGRGRGHWHPTSRLRSVK